MRVAARIDVSAPAELVWDQLADPHRYLHFMAGVTRWEAESGADRLDRGTRVRTLMRVGSAEIGGLIEVVEAMAPRELAWTSVTGIDVRGRWRLRPVSDERTHVELRLAYGVAGAGVWGWVAERLAAPTVRANLRRSLQQLKRQVEHEQTRALAARRRAARTG